MPELQTGLGVTVPGNIVQKLQQWQRWGMHNLQYGTRARKVKTLLVPVAAAALLAGAVVAGVAVAARRKRKESQLRPAMRRLARRLS